MNRSRCRTLVGAGMPAFLTVFALSFMVSDAGIRAGDDGYSGASDRYGSPYQDEDPTTTSSRLRTAEARLLRLESALDVLIRDVRTVIPKDAWRGGPARAAIEPRALELPGPRAPTTFGVATAISPSRNRGETAQAISRRYKVAAEKCERIAKSLSELALEDTRITPRDGTIEVVGPAKVHAAMEPLLELLEVTTDEGR